MQVLLGKDECTSNVCSVSLCDRRIHVIPIALCNKSNFWILLMIHQYDTTLRNFVHQVLPRCCLLFYAILVAVS